MIDKFGETLLQNYTDKVEIGKGAYGVVYKCYDNKRKEVVAMKSIMINLDIDGIPCTSLREISLLRQIQHKNVVGLKDVIIDSKDLYLVFEYLSHDLKKVFSTLKQNKQYLDSQQIKRFMYQLLSGVNQCHMKRVIHRDIKPANILVDGNNNLKIADFGLARTYSSPIRPYSQEVVTLWYRSPELLLGILNYSTPIDIWSIGCVFAEMVTNIPLFEGKSQKDQILRIFRILGTPNEQSWPGVTLLKKYQDVFPNLPPTDLRQSLRKSNKDQNIIIGDEGLDLLNKMLRLDPKTRISAKNALKHEYFIGFQP